MPQLATKCCSICKVEKPLDAFPVNKSTRSGRQGRCRPCDSEYTRAWREANPEKHAASNRRAMFRRVYGITPEQYDELLKAQGGVCAICGGDDPDGRRLAVDHCHDTDAVRGLLCRPCNTALGLFKDDPSLLLTASLYLRSLN